MGLFSRKKDDDRPMTPEEMNERSKVDGIRFKDLQVLGQLMKMNADLSAPREAIFYLYFADEPATAPVAEVLRGRGFGVDVRPPREEFDQFVVVATSTDRALIPDFLRETTDLCDELAARHGGDYDGWEAGLTEAEAAALKKK